MSWIHDPNALVGLLTLAVLEVVLNIDNIIFITILAGKLPREDQPKARTWGLSLALVTRVLFLLSIAWIMRLTAPLFSVMGRDISGRDLIMIAGGLFLIGKATHEIHGKLEGAEDEPSARLKVSLVAVVLQIMVIDIVFSIDSVVTAVGMVQNVMVMIIANVAALLVMMAAAGPIGAFVERHPTVKMLALAFLLMIGGNLLVDGFGYHVPKGYTYVAMAFSIFVETLNIRLRAKTAPVHLRGPDSGTK
ncbi:MAG TPA: TerC family protein [Gemmatimonadaceae bacterium]|nr:TerC family protein [Gemmatimonadaceae bacterium]